MPFTPVQTDTAPSGGHFTPLTSEQNAGLLGASNSANERLMNAQTDADAAKKEADAANTVSGTINNMIPDSAQGTVGQGFTDTFKSGLKFVKSGVRSIPDVVRGMFGMAPYVSQAEKNGQEDGTYQSDAVGITNDVFDQKQTPIQGTANAVLPVVEGAGTVLGAGELTGLGRVSSGVSVTEKGLQSSAKEFMQAVKNPVGDSVLKNTIEKSPLTPKLNEIANSMKQVGQKTQAEILSTPPSQVYKLSPVERKFYYDNAGENIKANSAKFEDKVNSDLATKSKATQAEAEQLNRQLQTSSRDEVLRLRPKIREAMGRQSEEYRRLVDEDLAPHVDEKVSAKDLRGYVFDRYADDPALQQSVLQKLGVESDFDKPTTLGQVYQKTKSLGQDLGIAARKGTRVYTPDEKLTDDAISTLSDFMSSKGVDLSRARSFWAKYAPIRNQVVSEAKPFLQADTQTKTFANTLRRVAEGTDVNNENFIGHVEDLIEEPIGKDIKDTVQKLGASEKKALADKISAETTKLNNSMKTDKALKDLSNQQFETERLARRRAIIKKLLLAGGAYAVDKTVKNYTGFGI